ncbi:hypothetical protein MCUN1_001863 [Malassezia cuniculi]|uniref:Fms-interacting protein n=1 Tax=Malassezia cuniculi TaxID=948313 RepID=A0AAF0EYI7_9BASI|nr:hypothetical protein MCUN1_001863 [Malassezia cuniculi]
MTDVSVLPDVITALAEHAESFAPDNGATSFLTHTAPLLAELKRCNRDAYIHLGEQRAAVAAERGALADAAAELNNLEYEKEQLQERIAAVNTLDTVYERVELCDLAEFREAVPDMETDDAHQFFSNRLQHELDVRRRLEQRHMALKNEAKAAADKNKAARDALVKLERAIDAVCASAEKTCNYNYQRTGTP